jgi:peptide/nickel transport system ATP-binding protein
MKQRVSIALAMLFSPEVIILDEATSGLDVLIEADILKLLHDLQESRGLSMIFVSHDRRITDEFCHRRINL